MYYEFRRHSKGSNTTLRKIHLNLNVFYPAIMFHNFTNKKACFSFAFVMYVFMYSFLSILPLTFIFVKRRKWKRKYFKVSKRNTNFFVRKIKLNFILFSFTFSLNNSVVSSASHIKYKGGRQSSAGYFSFDAAWLLRPRSSYCLFLFPFSWVYILLQQTLELKLNNKEEMEIPTRTWLSKGLNGPVSLMVKHAYIFEGIMFIISYVCILYACMRKYTQYTEILRISNKRESLRRTRSLNEMALNIKS